ncbi:MAG TPA: hypothetical protein VNQ56_18190 [Pseudolabrys sp.]|nr:hypothetical protein [Pseudolabrys sp.]
MMMIGPTLLVGASLILTVAEKPPELKIEPHCRAAASQTAGVHEDVDICIRTEGEAKEKLAQGWTDFSSADRTSCSSLARLGGGSTYTHLLTCLEIARDVRQMRASGQDPLDLPTR